jgi:hypothetical protein
VVAPDRQGRVLPALDFRPPATTTGTYRHVVREGDRIDQLASTYYNSPLIWWNICDANPDFLSPFELLGSDPVVTTLLPVLTTDATVPWVELVGPLRRTAGVRGVLVRDDVELVRVRRDGAHGGQVTVYLERPVRALLVTHDELVAPADRLVQLGRDLGWSIGPVARVGQVGREIVVPPAVNG